MKHVRSTLQQRLTASSAADRFRTAAPGGPGVCSAVAFSLVCRAHPPGSCVLCQAHCKSGTNVPPRMTGLVRLRLVLILHAHAHERDQPCRAVVTALVLLLWLRY